MVCTLIHNEYPSLLFCQTLFSYCFCMFSDFAKVFEWKVWRVQVAHLHNAARVLSSPSRCFQLSTNLGKDFFRYLWYCDKNQIEYGLAWYWWNSTDLGLIDMFLINLNTEIVACILSFRKSRHKPNLENTIEKFITWRGNSALNCTWKPISHESRRDECDIGFQVQFDVEFSSQVMNFLWIA